MKRAKHFKTRGKVKKKKPRPRRNMVEVKYQSALVCQETIDQKGGENCSRSKRELYKICKSVAYSVLKDHKDAVWWKNRVANPDYEMNPVDRIIARLCIDEGCRDLVRAW